MKIWMVGESSRTDSYPRVIAVCTDAETATKLKEELEAPPIPGVLYAIEEWETFPKRENEPLKEVMEHE